MAETKDDPTIENEELNDEGIEEVEANDNAPAIDPSLEGIQLFYEKNKKVINYASGGLVVLVTAFVYYFFSYMPEMEKEAANEAYIAQKYFDVDSFDIAVKGGRMVFTADGQKPMKGFDEISEEYSSTKIGNLANYYAGICYLRTGKFEQAVEKLEKYNINDIIIAPMAYGALGDAYMELNKLDEAVKYYLKAVEKSTNNFTTPWFLKKAGFAYELKANYAEALNMYERIEQEYGNSELGKEIKRDIAKVKALGNL
ncbi:MAG: tol-pal system YbgF family protein [Bacteroidia bacterium]